jgi:hypothetical protein
MQKEISAIMIVALILTCAVVAVSAAQPAVGVKKGEWVEYHVVAGGSPPAAQDITWAKIEILDVEGEQFHANFTVRYVNGTLSSSGRTFNFTAGDVQAWIIIPANLSPGESFYDSSINSTVTIQGQLVKNVAGANRVVTYTNATSKGLARHKEWDKATGFYIQSVDNIGTYTINANAYATNIWSPQILELNQPQFYTIIAVVVAVVLIILILITARKRKKT